VQDSQNTSSVAQSSQSQATPIPSRRKSKGTVIPSLSPAAEDVEPPLTAAIKKKKENNPPQTILIQTQTYPLWILLRTQTKRMIKKEKRQRRHEA
jgi:hypothetical protein